MEFNVSTKNRYALLEDEPDNEVVEEQAKSVKKSAKKQAGKGKGNVKNVKSTEKQVVTAPKLVAQPQQQLPQNRSASVTRPLNQQHKKPDMENKRFSKPAHFGKREHVASARQMKFVDETPRVDIPVGDLSPNPFVEATKNVDVVEAKKSVPGRRFLDFMFEMYLKSAEVEERRAADGKTDIFDKYVTIKSNKQFSSDAKKPVPEERVKMNRKARETKVQLGTVFQLPHRGRNRHNDHRDKRPFNIDSAAAAGGDGNADPSLEASAALGYSRMAPPARPLRGRTPRHDRDTGTRRYQLPFPRGEGTSASSRGGGGSYVRSGHGGGGSYVRGGRGGGSFRGGRFIPPLYLEELESPQKPAVVVDEVGW